jgi:hypothetical protein
MPIVPSCGCKTGITTSAVQLSTSKVGLPKFVIRFKAHPDNAGVVCIAPRANVTANGTDATDGYPLAAGESEDFPVEDLTQWYAISKSGTNVIHWAIV